LLPAEFTDIWNRAPKFPEEGNERIDVDSFVQIYRDIDDLFEKDEDDDLENESFPNNDTTTSSAPSEKDGDQPLQLTVDDDIEVEEEDALENELESIFESLYDSSSGLLSKTALRNWDEVMKLMNDGLLGEDEFEELWECTSKAPESPDKLDLDGFCSFNMALDNLFDFEDEDDSDDDIMDDDGEDTKIEMKMVNDRDLPPDVLFIALANPDGLVGIDELNRWGELQEMIADGDLLESELQSLFDKAPKSDKDLRKLDENGFLSLCKFIDELFEEVDENDDERNKNNDNPNVPAGATDPSTMLKEELLDAISDLSSPELLPCGLEALDSEQKAILELVSDMEKAPTNLVRSKQGAIEPKDLVGTWELLYSSSSAMKFNKGLSGLGGSFPNGKFGGLKQTLQSTNIFSDVEYLERIEVKSPANASFDVKVTGSWDLRSSVSLFTGEPSIVMTVEPDRVSYGPTSTRADHWKSLGPMNMLDITYLDSDLRIMRGNTAIESIFIFRRTQP
jgi:hypothetical protein